MKVLNNILICTVDVWDDPVLNVLPEEATRKLGELNTFTLIVPNVELFYIKPILNATHIAKELNMNERTVRNILITLENDKLITEHTGNKRNRKYIFEKYFKLF